MEPSTESRHLAAAAHGIELCYIDIWGRTHQTPDDVLDAIIGATGSPDLSRPLPPTLVVRPNTPFIPLHITPEESGTVKLEIQWEDGEIQHHWFWLPELPFEDGARRIPLPGGMRLGYHRIRVYRVKEPELETLAEAHFIVAPERAKSFEGRAAGVAVSLYGLRSARNWGCGDFTDLKAAIDSLARAGAAFIALNPLHAIPNRQPYNTSPYLPQCSLYRNFLYLDVERFGVPLTDAERAEIKALRATGFVEYEGVAALKLAVLRRAYDTFPGSAEFDAYIAREGARLHDFALYCALDSEMHRRDPNIWLWTDWPEPYRDARSETVAQFARDYANDVRFYQFLQWHVDRQLAEAQAHALAAGMKIGIYHDLALATDRWGADLWANGAFYARGARVGSPPDDFSPSGQDWAFPPPNREAHRENGYRLFAQSIRNNARHGGALRIDHVMRFFRLYWIPDGMEATRGAYVRDYSTDLLGVLALESVRANFIVIGEDLGTVTGEVRQSLAEHGILSYKLFWFERDGSGNFRRPEEYPQHAVVSTTTHDLPTLAGFATGRDIEARKDAGIIDEQAYWTQKQSREEEVARLNSVLLATGFTGDALGFLLATPCALAVINQEDLTGEECQQNLPGSTWQYPNWRRKMKIPVEEFSGIEARLKEAILRSGRRV